MAILASQVKGCVTCLREIQENIKEIQKLDTSIKNKTSRVFPHEDPPRGGKLPLLFSHSAELNEPGD